MKPLMSKMVLAVLAGLGATGDALAWIRLRPVVHPPPVPVIPVPLPRPILVPAYGPPAYPLPAYASPGYPVPLAPIRGGDLENHIERTIEHAFGRAIDDVDVDVDQRRRTVTIDVDVRHPAVIAAVQQFVYSMPELQGWYIRLRFDD